MDLYGSSIRNLSWRTKKEPNLCAINHSQIYIYIYIYVRWMMDGRVWAYHLQPNSGIFHPEGIKSLKTQFKNFRIYSRIHNFLRTALEQVSAYSKNSSILAKAKKHRKDREGYLRGVFFFDRQEGYNQIDGSSTWLGLLYHEVASQVIVQCVNLCREGKKKASRFSFQKC